MSGISFFGSGGGMTGVANIRPYLLAGGSAGGVQINYGDIVVLTTKSTLTSSGAVVCRTMLAADKTANYKQGTPVAGLLGVACWDAVSNASGQATAPAALGGVASGGQVVYPYGAAGLQGVDPVTSRNFINVMLFTGDQLFSANLTTGTATPALVGTLAGLTLSGVNGVFTIDTSAAAADQCLEIIGLDTSDPNYAAGTGTTVIFRMLGAFSQYLTAVPYSTN